MESLLGMFTNQFLVFLLVLTRVSGLMLLTPVWGARVVPPRVRALLALALALIISPLVADAPQTIPGDLLHLFVQLGCEFCIGLSLGLAVTIYFSGLELAGQVMGQMSGMSLAEVASPMFDANSPVFTEFLNILMVSVFVIGGGHHYMLDALLQGFQHFPPGVASLPPTLVAALTEIATHAFTTGLQLAAPMMLALLLAVVIMGLLSRTLPQLNILALGFSVNATVVIGALLLSIGVLVRVFHEQSFAVIDLLRPVFLTTHP